MTHDLPEDLPQVLRKFNVTLLQWREMTSWYDRCIYFTLDNKSNNKERGLKKENPNLKHREKT